MKGPARRYVFFVVLALLLGFAWWFDLGSAFSVESLQRHRAELLALRVAHPWLLSLAYLGTYVLTAALSLPGAAVLTVGGGAIFGLGLGTVLVSIGSTVGATLALLVARYLLRDSLEARYSVRLAAIDRHLSRDGAQYLFALRLVPVVPFFVVNLLMGLTSLPARTFFWVSQVGMLPATVVYVNAGAQIGALTSLRGILSWKLLLAFALLAMLPFVARGATSLLRSRSMLRRFERPRRFDTNLVVIGAGAAGLVASYIAAATKAKVTLVEKSRMGGDCLNYGCVPSKALIRSAKYASQLRRGSEYGFDGVEGKVNFRSVMERVASVVRAVEPHDSADRYRSLGVDVVQGKATITSPWTVEIEHPDGRKEALSTRAIVVATGGQPTVPPIPGLREAGFLTSDTLWEIRELPRRLVVLGGGPIGCELAQAFGRLGSSVTIVQSRDRLLPREDTEVSEVLMARLRGEGIAIAASSRATRVTVDSGEKALHVERGGVVERIPFDEILVAVGRTARLEGFGLEAVGVETDRTLTVNEFLQTNVPTIYACGDVAGPYQFTHAAAHMAWYATVNALFGPLLGLRGGRFRVDYRVIPWATFTYPEIAHVGLSEWEANSRNIPIEVIRYDLSELDRAIADGDNHGFIKVMTAPGTDRILGATIVGEHASDLLSEFVLAMRHGLGLRKILQTIHVYPSLAEANKYAAGSWQLAHQPERLLRLSAAFHRWRRR